MKIEFDPFAGSTDPSAPAEGDVILRVAISHGIDHDDAGCAYLDWVEADEVEVLDGETGRVRAQADAGRAHKRASVAARALRLAQGY